MTGFAEAWDRMRAKAARLKPWHIPDFFAADPGRPAAFSARLDDLLIDFSKEKIDADGLAALIALARAAGVEAARDAMFAGRPVNVTEGRAALHMALRDGAGDSVTVGGQDVMPEVRATRDRFLAFAEDIRTGRAGAADGRPFADVIAIGIGGSALGPSMAAQALAPFHDGPRVHFVSNVDGADLADTLRGRDPARTLVIAASKSFATLETMTNARSARDWLQAALGAAAGGHLAAVSANPAATRDFGIADERVFGFRDWVGGRFSVWSAIGLPLAIAIGADHFRAFLAGARAMDDHFRAAPLEQNLPVLLGMIGIWRRNGMGWPTMAVVPYARRLARFPAYLQQLEMESNGKRVQQDGDPARAATAPVVWGEPGTDAQHSFFQLLHQGTDIVPVDFILVAEPHEPMGDHHARLIANALAQSAALAFGRGEGAVRDAMAAAGAGPDEVDRLAPHRAFPGDRPSTTLLFRRLDPAALGRLMALYEHKVAVEGAIWNVNSFDQWGVELGKEMARRLLPAVDGGAPPEGTDASTAALLAHLKALREG